jgi:hypothetical protein
MTSALQARTQTTCYLLSAARSSREIGFPCTKTVVMLSYASIVSNGFFVISTRLATLPASIVPICDIAPTIQIALRMTAWAHAAI